MIFRAPNFSIQCALSLSSDSNQTPCRAPRRHTDQIHSSCLRSSRAGEATLSSSLALRPVIETASLRTDFNHGSPSSFKLQGIDMRWPQRSYERAQPLIRARSNGNGYASVDAPKSGNCSLLKRPSLELGNRNHSIERFIERVIFDCRFFTLMAIVGSLAGSLLCFCKGCGSVMEAFLTYLHASLNGFDTGQVIFLLVEAVDVYLMGTVLLIFGIGLYELFVSNIMIPMPDSAPAHSERRSFTSNFFGLFHLRRRPCWLEIQSLDELKTKLGHVIVVIMMVAMFEKSRNVPVNSGLDLLCFSLSIFMSSGCLFFLSKLHSFK